MSDTERILKALQRIEEAQYQLSMQVDAVSTYLPHRLPSRAPFQEPMCNAELCLDSSCVLRLRWDRQRLLCLTISLPSFAALALCCVAL